jgi:hypothetical protein
MFGPGSELLEFDYDNPVPEDVTTETAALTAQANAAVALVGAGWNAEDALSAAGLPPMRFSAPAVAKPVPAAAPAPVPVPVSLFGLARAQQAAIESGAVPEVEDALRWEVIAKVDDSVCDPCFKNDGHLYRNREDAYRDYPNGTSYVNCVGEEYGNQCRCKVVKRGKKGRETR